MLKLIDNRKVQAKIEGTLNSRNFLVSIVSLILLAFAANNLGITADADTIVETLQGGNRGAIFGLIVLNLLNPIMKIVSKGFKWSWDFVKSKNFWTQLLTVVLSAASLSGISFPVDAPTELIDGIETKEFQTIAISIVINILNPVWHFFFDKPVQPAA